jgi:shikimate dehydrogenase/3-dehydroquinate dehydratase type I
MEIVATFRCDAGRDPAETLRRPPAGATAVELRADLLGPAADLGTLVDASPLPVVMTLRSRAEGGQGPDDPAERRRFFAAAAQIPAFLFDLEAARDRTLLGEMIPREKAILSAHFPAGVPTDLEERAADLLGSGARFVKLVPHARSLDDALAVLRLAQGLDHGRREGRRAVVFAMGEAGRATRLLGPVLGAPLAFTAWDETHPTAPGQYTPAELTALIGHLSGRPKRVFAVLGKPAGVSLSPRMHAAAYRALGLPYAFVPLDVGEPSELDLLLRPCGESALDEVGFVSGGFAVTMPWKGEASRRCTVLAPRAQRAAAANTVLPRPGKVLGDCTDIDGLTRVLAESGAALGRSRALVLGAGGAARAAVVALQLGGAEVAVAARDAAEARRLARTLGAEAADVGASERCDVVINATPAGGDGAASEWLEALRLRRDAVVVDLPYGPVPTFLERLAGSREWRYTGGREVLLYQGVSQFAAMAGVAPPVRAMAAALGLQEVQA